MFYDFQPKLIAASIVVILQSEMVRHLDNVFIFLPKYYIWQTWRIKVVNKN